MWINLYILPIPSRKGEFFTRVNCFSEVFGWGIRTLFGPFILFRCFSFLHGGLFKLGKIQWENRKIKSKSGRGKGWGGWWSCLHLQHLNKIFQLFSPNSPNSQILIAASYVLEVLLHCNESGSIRLQVAPDHWWFCALDASPYMHWVLFCSCWFYVFYVKLWFSNICIGRNR